MLLSDRFALRALAQRLFLVTYRATMHAAYTLVLVCAAAGSGWADDDFPPVFNTQAEGEHPPSPEQMIGLIQLPPGFTATLFAGEPDVQQPIAMDFDDRGRLWVAENYTYSGGPYETKLRDRVIILEDTDGDGRHDVRKVFWDRGFMLTSLVWGYGGVWILHDGTLSFIPDRDGDDVPDSEPVVMLDGWSRECGHNFVNGLMWGPDGWLYGRHGIVDTSYPGVPGTPLAERAAINCGIWRFHPTRHVVDVVCNGTTNPWGLDYNADGQFFMTNNVQGHLWHVIPGAHYKRMYGQDFNPHAYELMDMTADHYHWDTQRKWHESRDGVANDLGGGHSHVGAMIYEGDNFPEAYRGKIFMCNTHGRRINVNRLERQGSGYVGRAEPDFMLVNTPWFRGVDIKIGPDDVMYVSDWADNGECHDHDGVHRTSGRIYRIAYGQPRREDVQRLAGGKRFTPSVTRYDWLGRHNQRLAQEAAASGKLLTTLADSFVPNVNSLLFYESLGQHPRLVAQALASADPLARAQAVRLAMQDASRRAEQHSTLVALAARPQPSNVLLALLGGLQQYAPPERWPLVAALLGCRENAAQVAGENTLTLMAWYGIEPVVFEAGALELLDSNPKLQQFAMRRIAHAIEQQPEVAGAALELVQRVAAEGDAAAVERATALLESFRSGLAGRARVKPPAAWAEVEAALRQNPHARLVLSVDALAVLFGDGAALADLRQLAADGGAAAVTREQAVQALAQAKDAESIPMLLNLLGDRGLAAAAIVALRDFEHPEIPQQLIGRFDSFKDGNQERALDTLAGREASAVALIDAIEDGEIDARGLSAAQVRQLLALDNDRIRSVLEARWGIVQQTPESRLAAIEQWKQQLSPAVLAEANLKQGAELFKTSCANCHKLFGEGKTLGPDLTGANRTHLDYLLINILDPSAIVPKQFTTSVVALADGRVITGAVVQETEQSLVVQTDKEQLTLSRDGVEAVRATGKSLMPDGLLDNLTPQQVRDLIGFIMQN
jgi:putative membrane-bound dehydrogenase-like protein